MSKRNHRARPPKRPSGNFDSGSLPRLLRLVDIAPDDADGLTTLLHRPGASANEPPLLNASCRSTRPHWVLRIAQMELAR